MRQLIVALLLSVSASAQSDGDRAIIATPIDASQLFSRLVKFLKTENYIVALKDSTKGFILTGPKKLKQHLNMQMRLVMIVEANTVRISGDVSTDVMNSKPYERISFGGIRSSNYRAAWDEMERIAKIIGTVRYTK